MHQLCPHSLTFPRSISSFFPQHRQLFKIKSLAPACPGFQPSSEGGRSWMMIVCVWSFNWKTFPEMERHTEEVISSSLIFPTFRLGLLGGTRYGSAAQRPHPELQGEAGCLQMRSGRQLFKPVSKRLASLPRGAESCFFLLCFSLDPHFTVPNPEGVAPPALQACSRWKGGRWGN